MPASEGLNILFDQIRVNWVQFIPPPEAGMLPTLTAYGEITNSTGNVLPRTVDGWDGVSDECKAMVVTALARLMVEKAAHELNTIPDRMDMAGNQVKIKTA